MNEADEKLVKQMLEKYRLEMVYPPKGSIEFITMLLREAILTTRKNTLEEAQRAMCTLCRRGVPVQLGEKGVCHEVRDGLVPRGDFFRLVACAAGNIRRLAYTSEKVGSSNVNPKRLTRNPDTEMGG